MADRVDTIASEVAELRSAVLRLQNTSETSSATFAARFAQLETAIGRLAPAATGAALPRLLVPGNDDCFSLQLRRWEPGRFHRALPECNAQFAHHVFDILPHSGGPVQTAPLHPHRSQHRDGASLDSDECAEALFRLRQTGSLPAYIAEFHRLANRASTVSSDLLLRSFIGGLKWDIKSDVRKHKPETPEAAIALAVQFEQKHMTPQCAAYDAEDIIGIDSPTSIVLDPLGSVETIHLAAPECPVPTARQLFDELPDPTRDVQLDFSIGYHPKIADKGGGCTNLAVFSKGIGHCKKLSGINSDSTAAMERGTTIPAQASIEEIQSQPTCDPAGLSPLDVVAPISFVAPKCTAQFAHIMFPDMHDSRGVDSHRKIDAKDGGFPGLQVHSKLTDDGVMMNVTMAGEKWENPKDLDDGFATPQVRQPISHGEVFDELLRQPISHGVVFDELPYSGGDVQSASEIGYHPKVDDKGGGCNAWQFFGSKISEGQHGLVYDAEFVPNDDCLDDTKETTAHDLANKKVDVGLASLEKLVQELKCAAESECTASSREEHALQSWAKMVNCVIVVDLEHLGVRDKGGGHMGSFYSEAYGAAYSTVDHLCADNKLRGNSLPSWALGSCSQLKTLLLYSKMLEEGIPAELGQLQTLQVLDVSRNSLSSSLPRELGNCSELYVLVLSSMFNPFPRANDTIVDSLLEEWGTMNDDFNYFQGAMPEEIPSGFNCCRKLQFFYVSSNRLTGELVQNLQVPCMVMFDIRGNFLSGSIPEYGNNICAPVSSMKGFSIKYDDPSSTYVAFFASKAQLVSPLQLIGGDEDFTVYNFGHNNFIGTLQSLPIAPERLGKQTLYAFLVGENKLIGAFPSKLFGKCDGLDSLNVNVSNKKLYGDSEFDMNYYKGIQDKGGTLVSRNYGDTIRNIELTDANGTQIQATVFNASARKFFGKFQLEKMLIPIPNSAFDQLNSMILGASKSFCAEVNWLLLFGDYMVSVDVGKPKCTSIVNIKHQRDAHLRLVMKKENLQDGVKGRALLVAAKLESLLLDECRRWFLYTFKGYLVANSSEPKHRTEREFVVGIWFPCPAL